MRNTIRWMMDRVKENGTRYNVTSCHVFKSTSWSLCSRCLERIKTLHDFFSIFDLPHGTCEHIYILKRNSIVSLFSYLMWIIDFKLLLRHDILCEKLMNVWLLILLRSRNKNDYNKIKWLYIWILNVFGKNEKIEVRGWIIFRNNIS